MNDGEKAFAMYCKTTGRYIGTYRTNKGETIEQAAAVVLAWLRTGLAVSDVGIEVKK